MKIADKINNLRSQLAVSLEALSQHTGISQNRITDIESGKCDPTGDEILILSDYFCCDHEILISENAESAIEKTEILYRMFGKDVSTHDRWAIQECIFFAENEVFLDSELKYKSKTFNHTPIGRHFKTQGRDGANALRQFLQYKFFELPLDIYKDFRSIGIKIFRRKLQNSNISGVFINHPSAGRIIVVNYSEDVYRQRFTVAHEAAHAIFDCNDEVSISFGKYDEGDLKELRANAFASNYLCPVDFIENTKTAWTMHAVAEWSRKMQLNPVALSIALKDKNLITNEQLIEFKKIRVPQSLKVDPELILETGEHSRARKLALLEKGLSTQYVTKCFDAISQDFISRSKAAEMLLIAPTELDELMNLFRVGKTHD